MRAAVTDATLFPGVVIFQESLSRISGAGTDQREEIAGIGPAIAPPGAWAGDEAESATIHSYVEPITLPRRQIVVGVRDIDSSMMSPRCYLSPFVTHNRPNRRLDNSLVLGNAGGWLAAVFSQASGLENVLRIVAEVPPPPWLYVIKTSWESAFAGTTYPQKIAAVRPEIIANFVIEHPSS
jgi:hypothetical protein